MSKNKVILAFAGFLVVVALLLWWLNRPVEQSHSSKPLSQQPQASPTPMAQTNQAFPHEYPQLSLQKLSKKEAIREYNQNTKRDLRYEWKIPIRFYGKVVDQNGDSVVGATVHLQWINLEGERGVGETQMATNAGGLFSLEGVKGKRLLVLRIEKDGYYDVTPGESQTNFEFANPAEQTFYEPDADNPVVFLMRKKGESQPLIVKSMELNLSGQGATQTIDLHTGKVSPAGGQIQVTVWKPTITTEQINAGKVFPYDWRIQVKVNGGGLIEHNDVFAIEAPDSGYVSEFDAKLHPTNGASADVTVNKQFYFYFGEPRKYGRLHLRTDGDRPYLSIDYWLNTMPGTRNLDYDPTKGVPSYRGQ